MKKVIGGKVYDTDTAKLLGNDNGDYGSFNQWSEDLYQKRTGEFFLYGEGGPSSKYAVSVGQNQWSSGSKIIPLNPDAARKWAEEHLNAEKYEEIFGIPEEDNGERATLCVQLPVTMMAKIRAGAAERQISITAYVEELLSTAF